MCLDNLFEVFTACPVVHSLILFTSLRRADDPLNSSEQKVAPDSNRMQDSATNGYERWNDSQ